ncbi:hypothetical protein I131_10460 [Enterococcus faecium CRL1879]|nr:hypothetical protein I131_10460 [Enterococcus faecium CRL1879]
MEPKDKYLDYARVNKDKFIETIIKGKIPDDEKDAVFMLEAQEQVKQRLH